MINSVLSNMVLYMLSFFHLPKGDVQRLDYFRSRFFWQCDNETKKYQLARWSVLCRPKSQGAWESKTLRLKISLFSASGFINYSLRMEYGRKSFAISMWDPMPFHNYIGNMGIHIFGVVS